MCEAGRIRHHLKHTLWDEKNSIVFVGYQAEGTLGKQLVQGAAEIKLFGETVVVNAQIHNLEGFSGHADQKGLLDWIGGFIATPKQIFLVHGEMDSKQDFAEIVKNQFGYSPIVITENSEFELETGKLLSKEEVIYDSMDEEDIIELKNRITSIKTELDNILTSTQGAMEQKISMEKLNSINSIILELEKASVNLGSSITAEDRDQTPLSEHK